MLIILFSGSNLYAQHEFEIIKTHYNNGEFMDAKEKGELLLKSDSTHYEMMDILSKIYENEMHLPKAIKYNMLKFRIDSSSTTARKIGSLYKDAGNISSAIPYFNFAHHKNDKDILAVKGMAECLFAIEDAETAQTYLQKGFSLDSNNLSLHFLNARVAYKLKDHPSVIKSLNKVQKERDLDNFFLRMIGFSYIQVDSADRAIVYLNRSLRSNNGIEHAYHYLALAYELKKDHDTAIHYYREAVKAGITESLGLYHRRMGNNFVAQNKWKEAEKMYRKSLEQEETPLVYFSIAQCLDKMGTDKKIVIKQYEQFIKKANQTDQNLIAFSEARVKELKEYLHMK